MKKRILAMAGLALAGACVNAGAVALNPKGLGQALLFPYYTVNQGQDTLLSIVNVSDVGKAVHVRFHEARNGRVALDFFVLLSPHDVWTAGVTAAGSATTSGARLVTSDHSCTLPKIPAEGLAFSSARYSGEAADGGTQTIDRTREGHIQIVTDGDIPPDSPTGRLIEHRQTGVPGEGTPRRCSWLEPAAVAADLVAPANTLAGSAGIVNVDEGTYFPYNADALSDFTRVPLLTGLSVADADDLSSANSGNFDGSVQATVFVDGTPLTLTYARGIDAVSAALMADHLYNEYLVSDNLGSNTDWVVTFPTKRFYVDTYYTQHNGAMPPFVEEFDGESNAAFRNVAYDREEGRSTVECCPIWIDPGKDKLPFEVQVFSWLTDTNPGDPSGVFGSTLRPNIPPYADAGWADFDLDPEVEPHALPPDASGRILRGLPVSGFMAYKIINTQAQPGRLANYSGVFPHRTAVSCVLEGATPHPCL